MTLRARWVTFSQMARAKVCNAATSNTEPRRPQDWILRCLQGGRPVGRNPKPQTLVAAGGSIVHLAIARCACARPRAGGAASAASSSATRRAGGRWLGEQPARACKTRVWAKLRSGAKGRGDRHITNQSCCGLGSAFEAAACHKRLVETVRVFACASPIVLHTLPVTVP